MKEQEKTLYQCSPSPLGYIFQYIIWGFLGVIIGAVIVDVNRRKHKYIITNKKVISNYSFLKSEDITIPLKNIQNISLTQSFFQKMFNIGDVHIDTSGGLAHEMLVKGIKNPNKFKQIIEENM